MSLLDAALNDFANRLGSSLGSVESVTSSLSSNIASSALTTVKSLATMHPAVAIAVGALSEVGQVARAVVGTFEKLGSAAVGGAASVSQVTNALSELPFGIGQIAKWSGLAVQVLEKNIQTHESLSKVGATFSGNLDIMRQSAAKSYLSLDSFSSVVNKNNSIFSTMGGNVENGVKKFVDIQNTLLAVDSPTAKNLATLGYSFEDAAGLTASFMTSQGSMNKRSMQDTEKIAQSVALYGQELDVLSKLTGQSREAIQKELDTRNQEAQWQAMLAGMAPEQAEKLRQGMQMALAQGGKGAVDAFQAMAMGLPPMTEEARLYTATQRAGNEALKKYVSNANDAGISAEENSKRNARILANQIAQGSKDREAMRDILKADAAAGGQLSKSFSDATKLQTKFKDMTEEQIVAELEKMNAESKREETQAADGKKLQQTMMDLTNKILVGILPAFNFLLGITVKVAQFMGKLFDKIAPAFDIFKNNPFVDFYNNYVQPIFDKISNIFSSFAMDGSKFGKTFSLLKDTLVFVGKIVLNVVDMVLAVGKVIANLIGPFVVLIAETFMDVINGVFEFFVGLAGMISGVIDVFAGLFNIITGDFDVGIAKIKNGFSDIFSNFFTKVLGTFVHFFVDIWQTFGNFLDNMLKSIKNLPIINFFTKDNKSVPDTTKPKADTTKPTADTTQTITNPNLQEIPAMAEGGIVTKATTALVGEGNQPEAIIPLSKISEVISQAQGTVSDERNIKQELKPETFSDIKNMFTEMQILNKQTTEILRYLRETADNTKRTVDATLNLNGNLFSF